MKAAALCYFYDEEYAPPPELRDAWRVDRWGVLPRDGGIEDQPIGYLDRMAWASATYKACKGYTEAPKLAAWIKNNPDLYDIYKEVTNMLAEDGLI